MKNRRRKRGIKYDLRDSVSDTEWGQMADEKMNKNKNLILALLVILVVILSGFFYYVSPKHQNSEESGYIICLEEAFPFDSIYYIDDNGTGCFIYLPFTDKDVLDMNEPDAYNLEVNVTGKDILMNVSKDYMNNITMFYEVVNKTKLFENGWQSVPDTFLLRDVKIYHFSNETLAQLNSVIHDSGFKNWKNEYNLGEGFDTGFIVTIPQYHKSVKGYARGLPEGYLDLVTEIENLF